MAREPVFNPDVAWPEGPGLGYTPSEIEDPAEYVAHLKRGDAFDDNRRAAELGEPPPSEEALVRKFMEPEVDVDGKVIRPGMNERQARNLARKRVRSPGDATSMEARRVANESLADYKEYVEPPADPAKTAPLFAAMRGGGSGGGAWQSTSSGTRFTTPEAAAEYQQFYEDLASLREEAAGRRGMLATEVEKRAIAMSQKRVAMDLLAQTNEGEARERMANIAQAYDEAEIDMASLRVDPRRWEQDTPALAQVLMGLGSAAFAFFTGGQGVNPIVALIDRAIERDTEAQMANMKAKLGAAQTRIDKQEVLNKLEGNIHASMWQRALNAYESMISEGNMQMAAEDQRAAADGLMAKALESRIASLEPYVRKYSMTMTGGGGAEMGAGKQLSAKYIDDYVRGAEGSAMEGLDLAEELVQLKGKGGSITPISSNDFLTKLSTFLGRGDGKAAELRYRLESFATRLARANKVDVGNFAVQESKRFINAIRGGDWNATADIFRNITRSIVRQQETQLRIAQSLHQSRYDVTGIAPAAEGISQRISRFNELTEEFENAGKK
jgi:hypothetical protein